MRLDIERYLAGVGLGFRPSGSKELVGRCWVCGKPDHCYVNKTTGKWHCFAGSCEASGDTISMLMHVEKVDFLTARRILASETMPRVMPFVGDMRDRLKERAADKVELVETELPAEFEPCYAKDKWRIPRYLKQRKIRKQTIAKFGIGFCRSGDYANRIVLPIRSPFGYSFTTRLTLPGEPRYLAGEGAGRLLFGWDVLERCYPDTGIIVLVEGPFDALVTFDAGLPVLALCGKALREPQRDQLRTLRETTFVLLLDPEAASDAVEEAAKLLNVKIGLLPGNKDPAKSSYETIRRTVARASSVGDARITGLRDRIKNSHSD